MSDTKFISKSDALALTAKGLEKWRSAETDAIVRINGKIQEAAAAGRASVVLKGSAISYKDGPILDEFDSKLVLSPRMADLLKEEGYELSYPHIGFLPDDKRRLSCGYHDHVEREESTHRGIRFLSYICSRYNWTWAHTCSASSYWPAPLPLLSWVRSTCGGASAHRDPRRVRSMAVSTEQPWQGFPPRPVGLFEPRSLSITFASTVDLTPLHGSAPEGCG